MAAAKRPLRVATESDAAQAKRKRPENLVDAVDMSERELLVAMRRKVAKEIDGGVAAAYLAPLTRQLRELDREIRLMDEADAQEVLERGAAPDEAFDASAI